MPLVQIFTSAPPPAPGEQDSLLSDLSKLLAARFHKPERWVMTCLCPGLAMTFGGKPAPSAFIAVKNVGRMTAEDTNGLSAALCDRVSAGLGVARDRIYIEFSDAAGYLWGWNGETFG